MKEEPRYEVEETKDGGWIVVQRTYGVERRTTLVSREYGLREEAQAEMDRLLGL